MAESDEHVTHATMWQQHIETWQASGLSQAAYCEQHELIYHRFGYWYRKLASGRSKGAGFARVVRPSQRRTDGLSVMLPNGIELRGIGADNLPVVGQLLRQLL